MDSDLYAQYCDFWELFHVSGQFLNRKTAAFSQWRTRSAPARQAMISQLQEKGAPANRNPYFWIQDFPEPVPTNYNGSREFDALVKTGRLCTAEYNGQIGIYTIDDATAYHMTIIKRLQP